MHSLHRAVARAAPIAAAAVLIAGCASAEKTTSSSAATAAGSSSAMSGMNMGGGSSASASSAGVSVSGIKPVPIQVLASTNWRGMKITARAMTPVPFVIYDGTHEQMVKPKHKTSFHLMVMLNDAQTNVPIPYASVWATIRSGGKVVYDERQWPMISRYMGPHYGNDVSVPGAGTYQLSARSRTRGTAWQIGRGRDPAPDRRRVASRPAGQVPARGRCRPPRTSAGALPKAVGPGC